MKPSFASVNAAPENPRPPKKTGNPLAAAAKTVHRALVRVWLLPVAVYRKYVSPLKGRGSCRFTPTCSAYAMDAVREWGILCGTLLAVIRVIRCNPFSRGGHDPVPTRKEVWERIRGKKTKRTPD